MDNKIKYDKCVHADGTVAWYDSDGKEVNEPEDATSENTHVMTYMECVE